MAFDFSSFFSGFAESAAVQVEKRSKEIRDATVNEIDRLSRLAEENQKTARLKRDEMVSQANYLKSLKGKDGIGFNDQQILGMLQSGRAKDTIATLKQKEELLGDVDFSTIAKVIGEPTDVKLDDEITKLTTLPTSTQMPEEKKEKVRGAFGLPTVAAQRAEEQYAKTTGKTVDQLRAEAKGLPAMPVRGDVEIDMTQFKDPETLSKTQAQLADNISKGIGFNDPKNAQLLKRLQAFAVIKDAFDGDEKNRTAGAINTVLDKSLKAAMGPLMINNVVRYDEKSGEYIPNVGDAKSIASFMDHRNNTIKKQAISMGILGEDGTIKGGRAAFDALLPYAEIEGGKVKSWRTVTTPPPATTETPTAPAAKTTLSEKPLAVPVDPKTGKIDGTKLVLGQKYTDSNGKVKTWNGMSWQD